MTVRYRSKNKELLPSYVCQRKGIEHAEKICQNIPGAALDKAVSNLLLEVITPLALEVTLAVQEELKTRADEVQGVHYRQVERLIYETELAKRRYMRVDPDNRLVADELESDWNARLRELTEARQEHEKICQRFPDSIAEEQRLEIEQIAADFPGLWLNEALPDRERKRILRLILEDVTLLKGEQITAHIRFKGGATKKATVSFLPKFLETFRTKTAVVQEIDRLLENHTYEEIAAILNESGFTTGTRQSFTRKRVYSIFRKYKLKDRFTSLRETGLLTAKELAEQWDVLPETVKEWRRQGILNLDAHKVNDNNVYLYEQPSEDAPQNLDVKKHFPGANQKILSRRR